MISIELPKNPWKNPEVTAMLDRTKITSNQAVGFFSSLMKTGKVEGKEIDLNNFTLSQSSIERTRNINREKLVDIAKKEFGERKPKHGALHWDGKMMKTVLKKMKAKKHLTLDNNIVKKLLKLRKWMDQINPDFHVNDQETNN